MKCSNQSYYLAVKVVKIFAKECSMASGNSGFVLFTDLPVYVVSYHFIVARCDGERILAAKIIEAPDESKIVVPHGYKILCEFARREDAVGLINFHRATLET